jgi:hypothetical protein
MAPELENYWFHRTGRFCGARPIGWPGRLITGLYSLVVTGSAYLLVDRTILGFVVVAVVATVVFMLIIAAKTRGGLGW